MNRKLPYKRPGRPSKKPNIDILIMEYEAMTAPELAREYGVSVSTIRRWVEQIRKGKYEK